MATNSTIIDRKKNEFTKIDIGSNVTADASPPIKNMPVFKPSGGSASSIPKPEPVPTGTGLFKYNAVLNEQGTPTGQTQQIELSPQEIATQKTEGGEYIRQRENITGQLLRQGYSQAGAERIATQELSRQAQTGIAPLETLPSQIVPDTTNQITTPSAGNVGGVIGKGLDILTAIFAHPFSSLSAAASPETTIQDVIDQHFSQELGTQIKDTLIAGVGYAALVTGTSAVMSAVNAGRMTAVAGTLVTKSSILSIAAKSAGKQLLKKSLWGFVGGGWIIGKSLSTSQNVLNEDLSVMDNMAEAVANGQMGYSQALSEYNKKKSEISRLYGSVHYWGFTRGWYVDFLGASDTLGEFEDAKSLSIPALENKLENARQIRIARFGAAG